MTDALGEVDRLRVLIGAYACGPVEEPEAAAGWAFAVAAARDHDVWVITRARFATAIASRLREQPDLAQHLTVEFLELPFPLVKLKRHSWDMYWYYALWQAQLLRRARMFHREVDFDVAHHVTFANDWLPCGLGLLDVPLVWGPIGGASRVPVVKLRRWLGTRGVLTELLRNLVTGALRLVFTERVARRAAVVVAQNEAVGHRFRHARRVVVEPNAALDPVDSRDGFATRAEQPKTAIFVGRLTAWKGARLALAVLAHPLAAGWRLRVFGEGHERSALEQLSGDLGVADRVDFVGHRPRAEVLAAFAAADALLFPSFHDQAGWVAAEASSVGCNVVCLPLGGPPLLAAPNAFVASLEGDLVKGLAEQLMLAGRQRGEVHNRWDRARLPALLGSWYEDAASTSGRDR